MSFPANLKYSEEHEWVRVETVDETIAKDEVFGTVEAVKTTSDLFMPVSGKILEFNPALDENEGDDPTLANKDPYGEGWIVKIEMTDPSELDALMDATAYEAMVS